MALMTAKSSGGKSGLAPAARPVREGEVAARPPLPPRPNGIRVESERPTGVGIGEVGPLVKSEGQFGPLAQVERGGAASDETPSFREKAAGEMGAVRREGAGHGGGPNETIGERITDALSHYTRTPDRQPLSQL